MNYFREIIDRVNPNWGLFQNNFFLEITNNGFLPYNTASVQIKAFKDKEKHQELKNLKFEWYWKI